MPAISVILPCYKENVSVYREAVDSILNQTLSDFELLLILDCPDNHVLERCIYNYAELDRRVIPVIHERNMGLPATLNDALSRCRGDYVCRMDADDIALPDRLELQFSHLKTEGFDLVGSYVEVIDEDGITRYTVNNIPTSSEGVSRALRYNNCVPHPTWFGKKELFQLGYRSIPQSEDYDFLLRAVLEGYNVGNVGEVTLKYRQTSKSLSRSNLYRQFQAQRYLTNDFRKDMVSDVNGLSNYLDGSCSVSKMTRYAQADTAFNNGLESLRGGAYWAGVASLIRVPFLSLSYCSKVFRMLKASLCR